MKAPTSLCLLLLSLLPSALGALLAVDYGTEWTKASLIKPGTPLDVLLDKDSKRKMQSVVGYKRDERVFGGEAVNAATRFPLTHFPYVKPLLALTDLPPSNISSIYPSQPQYDSATQTIYFPHDSAPAYALNSNDTSSSTKWSAGEILAHELNYIKALASAAAMEPVTDLFLTVPAYFTQHQRRAFKDAAEVAGLSLVGSVGEGAAVGLNYAMTRQFPKLKEGETAWSANGAQIDVIYDSGAMKTTASVIAFYTADVAEDSKTTVSKSGKKSKLRPKSNPTTHVHVLATASQPTLGGIQIDQALRDILVKDVADKLKLSVEEVKGDDRAMRKLWKEAARTKAILSANQEASVNIESLMNDADYRSRISRSQLEEACTAFANKFGEPIEDALAKAGLRIGDINSVILFGGNTRVPFVQTAIKAALGGSEDKIAQNVNTDEAAVLGAAYYGASQGRSVMSKLKLKVIEGLDWDVRFDVVDGNAWKVIKDEPDSPVQGQIIFPAGTNLTTKRVLTFAKADKAKLSDTLGVEFMYTGNDAPAPPQLVRVDVKDISKAFVNMTDVEIAASHLKLTMRLDSRGFVQAANAVVHIPTTPKEKESVADKLKGLFSGSNKDEADKAEEALKSLEAELEELERNDKEKKVALKFSEVPLGIKPLTAEAKKQARARLAAINKVEADVSARAEGRNLLEGYLYRLSGLLSADGPSDALFRFGTDSEREKLDAGVKGAFEWMNEEGDSADVQTLLKKRADLESVEYPITRRYKEASTRPKAIDDFQKVMSAARIFFVDAQRNLTEAVGKDEPSRHTQDELDDLLTRLKENESWMKEKMEAHKKIEDDFKQDPVILTADLNEKGKALQMMVIRLGNKRIPKPIKTKSKTTTATETTEGDDPTSTSAEPSGTSTEPTGSKPTETDLPAHEEL